MQRPARTFLAAVISAVAFLPVLSLAQSANEQVSFPGHYENDVHYTTVTRGNIREELFTSPEAIEAARQGQPLPDGTVIMMEDYRGDELYRYIVMEKRAEWEGVSGAGQWLFREFGPDRSPNLQEDGSRCAACHQPKAANDYVFTMDRLRAPASKGQGQKS